MVETQREREERLRREAATRPNETRTGTDPSMVAVDTVPGEEYKKTTTTTERITPGMTATTAHTAGREDKPMTQKVGDTLREAKEDVKDVVTPGRTEATRGTDWDTIKHPAQVPSKTDPYGTRPVSELTPPPVVTDKADLAALRMMERDRTDLEQMDRERIMTEATPEAAAARAAMLKKEGTMSESEAERQRRARAMATGTAVGAGAAATRTSRETTTETVRIEPAAGERTIRQGAAIGTEPTRPTTVVPPVTERPVTGTVVPPGVTRTTPLKPYGTVDERARMHAEDPSVHPDWETQPQINAPRDVGIPTAEGQADAARLRAGGRRSKEDQEPRIDRRGGDYEVPAASGARMGKDDRSITEKAKDAAVDVKESAKETTRDVKRDIDRKV